MWPFIRIPRHWLRWPLWLLSPLGSGHDFRHNPVIGSPLLNRLGLHICRLLLARAMTGWRRLLLRGLVSPSLRADFHRDGFIQVAGLLSRAEFEKVRREVRAAEGEVRECIQGDTLTHRLLLDHTTLRQMPALRALLGHPVFAGAVRYAGASNSVPLHYIQSIRNGVREGRPDPQKVLHSDTFHPTVKAWFFLEDVSAEQGPFTYVPGSHRLDGARLRWEYRRSCIAAALRDGYSEKGSFRVEASELPALGLPSPRSFPVPANTLIVADTSGMHCRGQAVPGSRRLEIWAYSRLNPFNPWPGIDSALRGRLYTALLRRKWERLDRQAAARGEVSSWHRVASAELHRAAGD
jgi:Phytanoyl-CoA dioxygenase (PhyH)